MEGRAPASPNFTGVAAAPPSNIDTRRKSSIADESLGRSHFRHTRRLLFIFLNQTADGVRRLSAAREPVLDAVQLECAVVPLLFRIVSADELKKFSVARTAFIGHDHFIIWAIERPFSAESN